MTSLNFIHCYFCKYKILNIDGHMDDTIIGRQFIQDFKIPNLHSGNAHNCFKKRCKILSNLLSVKTFKYKS